MLIAENMNIEDACLLVRAEFAEFYADDGLQMQIRRMKREGRCNDVSD